MSGKQAETQKLALVTGASEGIGRAFAQQLAAEGYSITAVARNEARLQELVKELGAAHRYLVADLSKPAEIERIANELKTVHHHLLVNNAGIGLFGKFFEVPIARQLDMMRVNMEATVILSHAFLSKAESGDALINLSSGVAFQPLPASGIYAATKAFITSFSECLWYEQKPRGVYVMGLTPGPTETNFVANAGAAHHKPPASLMQTPAKVVETAMAALKSRKEPTVVSGTANKIFNLFARLRSRKAVVSQMGSMFPDN